MTYKCPWCGSEETQQYLSLKDYFLTFENFEIYECRQCKLKFTVPVPQELGHYYKSEKYLSHSDKRNGLFAKIYNIVKKKNIKNKYKYSCGDLKVGNVLDIGCGVGDYLNYCKSKGWNIAGVEPDADARKISENKLNVNILRPNDLSQIPDNSFDVVTMWHVLEHVENLHEEIRQLERIVKNGGRLVIALPNHNSFDAQFYGEFWAAYDVPRHLMHFSKECIKNIFKSTSFELKNIKGMKWDSYYISILSEKYANHHWPFFRGLKMGLTSNIKAKKNEEYSSLIYVFEKKLGDRR